jgi:hypothetical protein
MGTRQISPEVGMHSSMEHDAGSVIAQSSCCTCIELEILGVDTILGIRARPGVQHDGHRLTGVGDKICRHVRPTLNALCCAHVKLAHVVHASVRQKHLWVVPINASSSTA